MRYLTARLRDDLQKKMVLLAGPRQCGKTTLAKSLLNNRGEYLNWDITKDRKIIREIAWPKDASLVVLDELHKAPKWKNLLKGVVDEFGNKPPLLVTGVPAACTQSWSSPGEIRNQNRAAGQMAGRLAIRDEHCVVSVVVFAVEGTAKSTIRSAQEYSAPLFVLSGVEYASVPFSDLHARLCDALRGDRPRIVAEVMRPDGNSGLIFEE
jgi:hypothetical protein